MKGVVFTELISMAEEVKGEEFVDELLEELPLTNGGAYTSVGKYPCSELFVIVGALSERLGAPPDALQRQFGHWMLGKFAMNYPQFFEGKTHAFDMLQSIENEVHVEVRKLYPDAELPTFETIRENEDTLTMIYHSARPLGHFCHGLIEACLAHFNVQADIKVSDQNTAVPGSHVRFEIAARAVLG